MPRNDPPHPGAYVIEECIRPLDISVAQAAAGLGVSRSTLSRLINGQIGVSPEMAVRLSRAFGSTSEMWLRLQNAFDLAQTRKRGKGLDVRRFEKV